MTRLSDEQLAALVAEFKQLNGALDVSAFSYERIYCCDCMIELSAWSIEGETYCSEHFSAHIVKLVEEARTAYAMHQQLVATATALVAQARAEGLTIVEFSRKVGYGADMSRCRTCCHQEYAFTIEGKDYCLGGTVAILREVLDAPAA